MSQWESVTIPDCGHGDHHKPEGVQEKLEEFITVSIDHVGTTGKVNKHWSKDEIGLNGKN